MHLCTGVHKKRRSPVPCFLTTERISPEILVLVKARISAGTSCNSTSPRFDPRWLPSVQGIAIHELCRMYCRHLRKMAFYLYPPNDFDSDLSVGLVVESADHLTEAPPANHLQNLVPVRYVVVRYLKMEKNTWAVMTWHYSLTFCRKTVVIRVVTASILFNGNLPGRLPYATFFPWNYSQNASVSLKLHKSSRKWMTSTMQIRDVIRIGYDSELVMSRFQSNGFQPELWVDSNQHFQKPLLRHELDRIISSEKNTWAVSCIDSLPREDTWVVSSIKHYYNRTSRHSNTFRLDEVIWVHMKSK